MPGGRPSIYSNELCDTICNRIALGESLRSICRDAGMPDLSTVIKWRREKPEFFAQYEKAQEDRADTLSDDICDIADSATPEYASVAKLQVDARKWVASKLKPKKYGEAMLNKIADSEGNALKFEPVIISRSDK